ncbi:hypothetical protein EJ03DRAFT_51644 [Teratosphaeria nubilosa]|uniref:Uncharacterized protein n=1 Tax=Teratosphaeria nubilosa TaxID=161662 RepID=A0A6G1LDL0_9PEZI|nr:hypothetical protein EJ03DRAFT_51644 [Teratosphaeria nubilosa]
MIIPEMLDRHHHTSKTRRHLDHQRNRPTNAEQRETSNPLISANPLRFEVRRSPNLSTTACLSFIILRCNNWIELAIHVNTTRMDLINALEGSSQLCLKRNLEPLAYAESVAILHFLAVTVAVNASVTPVFLVVEDVYRHAYRGRRCQEEK